MRAVFPEDLGRATVYQPFQTKVWGKWVLQGNGVNGVAAYTRQKGKRMWFFKVPGGLVSDLLIAENKVFFAASDGFLYALNVRTGHLLWKKHLGEDRVSRPTFHKGLLYFTSPFRLYVWRAESGTSVWSHLTSPPPGTGAEFVVRALAPPLVTKNRIYYRGGGGMVFALNHRGKVLWKRNLSPSSEEETFASRAGSLVLRNRTLFVADLNSGLYALNKNTGQVIWTHSKGSPSQVVLSGQALFYPTSDGHVLALNPQTGAELWSHPLPPTTRTPALLSLYRDKVIYGQYRGGLRALSQKTGKVAGFFDLGGGGGLSSPPAIPRGRGGEELYFLSHRGHLYKIKLSL